MRIYHGRLMLSVFGISSSEQRFDHGSVVLAAAKAVIYEVCSGF
jgi:hypothetical protein